MVVSILKSDDEQVWIGDCVGGGGGVGVEEMGVDESVRGDESVPWLAYSFESKEGFRRQSC